MERGIDDDDDECGYGPHHHHHHHNYIHLQKFNLEIHAICHSIIHAVQLIAIKIGYDTKKPFFFNILFLSLVLYTYMTIFDSYL